MRSKLLSSLFLTISFFTLAQNGLAATIAVTTTSIADSDDSSCSLSEAVKAASTDASYHGCTAGSGENDFISLPAGTYCLSTYLNVDSSITIVGAGYNSTVLDGGSSSSSTCSPTYAGRFMALDISNGNITLDSLAIVGMKPSSSTEAIAIGSSSPTVNKVTFNRVKIADNTIHGSSNFGGVVSMMDGNLEIIGSVFENNKSEFLGLDMGETSRAPAIQSLNSNLMILNTTFQNNSVTHSADYSNTGTAKGGAIYFSVETSGSYSLSIEGCTFSDNTVESATGDAVGGAIYASIVSGQNVHIINSTFSDNEVSSSSASSMGGAIYLTSTTASNKITLDNVTIADGNSAVSGGGIYHAGLTPLKIKNSIIADNTALTGPDCTLGATASMISSGYNIIGDSTGCSITSDSTDLLDTDPKLYSLADNGGITKTMATKDESPAIDSGSCSGVELAVIAKDQRNSGRVSPCDRGAYENNESESVCDNHSDDDFDGFTDCDDTDCSTAAACTDSETETGTETDTDSSSSSDTSTPTEISVPTDSETASATATGFTDSSAESLETDTTSDDSTDTDEAADIFDENSANGGELGGSSDSGSGGCSLTSNTNNKKQSYSVFVLILIFCCIQSMKWLSRSGPTRLSS